MNRAPHSPPNITQTTSAGFPREAWDREVSTFSTTDNVDTDIVY